MPCLLQRERRRLRRAMRPFVRHFIWQAEAGGTAYETTLQGLHSRVHWLQGGIT